MQQKITLNVFKLTKVFAAMGQYYNPFSPSLPYLIDRVALLSSDTP